MTFASYCNGESKPSEDEMTITLIELRLRRKMRMLS
jgi:hypothetical protein